MSLVNVHRWSGFHTRKHDENNETLYQGMERPESNDTRYRYRNMAKPDETPIFLRPIDEKEE